MYGHCLIKSGINRYNLWKSPHTVRIDDMIVTANSAEREMRSDPLIWLKSVQTGERVFSSGLEVRE